MNKKILVFVSAMLASTGVFAGDYGARSYAVTVTNITPGQTFTPLLLATHSQRIRYFELGDAASMELATIAESGNIAPLDALLQSLPKRVYATANSAGLLPNGLLGPGQSVTVEISARGYFNRLSLAGMLIPTNDSFVALDSVALPVGEASYFVPAYDAGSEFNDELCANIPGPVCGGAGLSDEDGEGYVHISGGIHGIGDLEASSYDWKNPVAKITIRRVH
jgi:hypothetical protein